MEMSLNKNFEEMSQNEIMDGNFMEMTATEIQEVDGGIAWALVGLGIFCGACFGMGVYNGYKGNS